ncbi:DISARM system helicase DrmA [Streptomyces sp. SAS_281]|uniref:DISARM system helicase DrmA n=1 Tax=Streptomyces sp. SAS_281 TaxID=3412744 RepID=UPI00403CA2FD
MSGSSGTQGSGKSTTEVTSFQVRGDLERFLERDLHGPWDGDHEELLAGTSPAEQYLLGRLVPRLAPAQDPAPGSRLPRNSSADGLALLDDPALRDDLGDDEDDDEEGSEAVARAGRMAASAIGVSFRVSDDVDIVLVRAAWGRYQRSKSEHQQTDLGNPRTVWVRHPAGGAVEIPVDKEAQDQRIPDPNQDQVLLRYTVRHRRGQRVVDVSLINAQTETATAKDETRLYQVQLTATALDGHAAIFVAQNDPELGVRPAASDDEKLHLALLYRERRQFAHGRQCSAEAKVRPGEKRAHEIRTTCFPEAEVPLIQAADIRDLPGVELDMEALGKQDLARDGLVSALSPLVTGYREWLALQEERIATDAEVGLYEPSGTRALRDAHDMADRLERAIQLLHDNGLAREAFRFANQAMALQRVRSELVRARAADPDAKTATLLRKLNRPENRSWRPFQLAFLLLCLPGLTDPAHPDAHRSIDDGEVQLLFFPTGGGKTEAYLGLTAYTFAIRRLQGVQGDGGMARDGGDGVAVLMRYTLRLLTAQQFQRAAALVCACEWLRRERIAAGDTRWGDVPFRIGLWVGKSVTPNSFEEAKRQIDDNRNPDGQLGGPLQLAACPWCGTPLAPHCLSTSQIRRRTILACPDPTAQCPFTPRHSPDEGLPVVTVDEEIYRLTPALVIATVDKFAQLPWSAATATLFGLAEQRCARHGWHNPDFDSFCRSYHPAAQGLPRAVLQPAVRPRPPDLIIQDELHLISDALGSMVGLYETVVDKLATRVVNGREIRPVVVASTATVRRARDQVEQVFARGLAVFPPQVLDAGETFFSRVASSSPDTPGRRYRGIMAPGERLKAVEIRVAAAILEHAQCLFDRHGLAADPYMTLVDYFTATKELAGMRRLIDDDIADRLRSSRVRTRRKRPTVAELTSRMPSSRIAGSLAQLDGRFDPEFDSTDAINALVELRKADPEAAKEKVRSRRSYPIDVLLATSMLQVGVDVQRLGLMLVTGQPKNTAEYIQATSRVGRDKRRPGLVLTIYNWSRPRDLAHFETFEYEHATFGMRVEGLTTTPFSERALDRGLTAIIATALRHSGTAALPNPAAHDVALSGPFASALIDAVADRAGRVTHDKDAPDRVRKEVQHRLDRWHSRRSRLQTGRLGYDEGADLAGLLKKPDSGPWDLWSAPRSMREVEPQVVLQLDQEDPSLDEAPLWDYDRKGGNA